MMLKSKLLKKLLMNSVLIKNTMDLSKLSNLMIPLLTTSGLNKMSSNHMGESLEQMCIVFKVKSEDQ